MSTRPTPLTDALVEHGSKYYNHPRYDKKVLDHARQLERDRQELMEALNSLRESSAIVLNWTPGILNSRAVVLKRDIEKSKALLSRLTPNRTGGNDQSSQDTPEN